MSSIFFDHLIEIDYLTSYIDEISSSDDEKVDLWNLVDEFINQRIISSILTQLDEDAHQEFMDIFLERPYDVRIIDFLNEKMEASVEDLIALDMQSIMTDLDEMFEIQTKRLSTRSKTTRKLKKKK